MGCKPEFGCHRCFFLCRLCDFAARRFEYPYSLSRGGASDERFAVAGHFAGANGVERDRHRQSEVRRFTS